MSQFRCDTGLGGILQILDDLYRHTHGSGMVHITKGKFESIRIGVPKTEEDQRRIVAEIEKQFSRLDEAVASLKRVKANLKRYKAAVLKAAVEGKLTEEWRKQNPDVEPASKLLERILAERRLRWEEAELAKMKAKGKQPKDDKWKENLKHSSFNSADAPFELPSGWVWTTVDALLYAIEAGKSFKCEECPPYLGKPEWLRLALLVGGSISSRKARPAMIPRV